MARYVKNRLRTPRFSFDIGGDGVAILDKPAPSRQSRHSLYPFNFNRRVVEENRKSLDTLDETRLA